MEVKVSNLVLSDQLPCPLGLSEEVYFLTSDIVVLVLRSI